ncbi:unnamed protein product [Rhizoctonia solani]|uniref:Laminin domain protein n=1 Tax=Rhizoctonia solani TaxID=456999 RepID=A0A8H2Y122_9AGAM|nr:unnamed protein product [Rhizoctonia solani]
MSADPTDSICLPPDLPPYLKDVHDLKPILGVPNDEEVIGIHAVIRMASKVVDVPGVGDSRILAQLSEHLFSVQMGKYRKNYLATVFPQDTTFTPPTLPVHVAVQLEPITGAPSDEEMIKVQQALRSYHQFANAPSLFNPRTDMELSQHLFNIQMARYKQHAGQNRATTASHDNLALSSTGPAEQTFDAGQGSPQSGNNVGTGASVVDFNGPAQSRLEVGIQAALERSNGLAEQAKQLMERSNQIAEQTNLLIERANPPGEQLTKQFTKLFERMNQHLEQSNSLAERSIRPVEKLGEVLGNINRVLMKIQHAIIRSHKGNQPSAFDCLVNEKGETPVVSCVTENMTFTDLLDSGTGDDLSVMIDGKYRFFGFDRRLLDDFLQFYGIEDRLSHGARKSKGTLLGDYLSSCIG